MLLSILVLLLLVALAVYYLYYQKDERNSSLIGDKVCGSPLSERAQDACCYNAHKGEAVVTCVGQWRYVNGEDRCQFVCNGSTPACSAEVKVCPSGFSVSRNATNECLFDACP